MMNVGFTFLLLGLLAAALLWIAVVDIRTYTISDRLNLGIALLAPVYWWAAACRSGLTRRCKSESRWRSSCFSPAHFI